MELIVLQFHDNVAMKDAVMKHKVGIKVFIIDDDTFLTGLETEALAQFKEKILKVADEGVFQVVFRYHVFGIET